MTREIKVAILTPYLTENLKSLVEESPSKEWLSFQIEKAKYNPNNFSEVDKIKTGRNIVSLLKIPGVERLNDDILSKIMQQAKQGFTIAGSTEDFEDFFMNKKGTGAIVARYSIFFGGNSKYTGRSPAESGYSLDIPKNPEIVKTLLREDNFLDSIRARDESGIISALDNLNKRISTPVLTTPYLSEALQLNREKTEALAI